MKGSLEAVMLLCDNLGQSLEIDRRSSGAGNTACLLAALNDQLEVVIFLVLRGADIEFSNALGQSPLSSWVDMCKSGTMNPEIKIQRHIAIHDALNMASGVSRQQEPEQEPEPEPETASVVTQIELNQALVKACGLANDLLMVLEMLNQGANIDALVGGRNALAAATMHGNLAIVTTLISKGCSLETGDVGGRTAICLAALWDEHEVAIMLALLGADPEATSASGQSALKNWGDLVNANFDPKVRQQRVLQIRATALK